MGMSAEAAEAVLVKAQMVLETVMPEQPTQAAVAGEALTVMSAVQVDRELLSFATSLRTILGYRFLVARSRRRVTTPFTHSLQLVA
jgi:hypothetical protein